MIIFNERADLRIDGGSIKPHHKKLPHLPIGNKEKPIVSDNPSHIIIAEAHQKAQLQFHPEMTEKTKGA